MHGPTWFQSENQNNEESQLNFNDRSKKCMYLFTTVNADTELSFHNTRL